MLQAGLTVEQLTEMKLAAEMSLNKHREALGNVVTGVYHLKGHIEELDKELARLEETQEAEA